MRAPSSPLRLAACVCLLAFSSGCTLRLHRAGDGRFLDVAPDWQPGVTTALEVARELGPPDLLRWSAQRMTFHLLQHDREGAQRLAQALQAAASSVRHCERCHTFTDAPVCAICREIGRASCRERVFVGV